MLLLKRLLLCTGLPLSLLQGTHALTQGAGFLLPVMSGPLKLAQLLTQHADLLAQLHTTVISLPKAATLLFDHSLQHRQLLITLALLMLQSLDALGDLGLLSLHKLPPLLLLLLPLLGLRKPQLLLMNMRG